MKPLFTLMLLSAALIFSGCEDDFEDSPFRCKINGEEFKAKDLINVSLTGSDNFYIQATSSAGVNPLNNEPYGEIKFDVYVDSVGTYPLNLQNTWRWSNNGDQTFRASGTDPGTLTITAIDFNTKKISGTFELTAYNDAGNTTKTVTDGFFDLSW